VKIIANIAGYLRGFIEKKDEVKEPSGGFLSHRIREKAVFLIGDHRRLLDVGVGEGLLLKDFESDTRWFYGIDREREWLEQASKRCFNRKRSLFIRGDGRYLPFKDNVFDAVTILNLFMNIPEGAIVASIIHESLRVCKDRGVLIFDFRNMMNPWIFTLYKTVKLHDPDIQLPLRAFTRGEIKGVLGSVGVYSGVFYYPVPSWWRINPPVYVVEIEKRGDRRQR
jgi:ubiquinone/menaquinone biosynthesis C-methylase UbiE